MEIMPRFARCTVSALFLLALLLTACGGSSATDTPAATTAPTRAATTAPTTAAASASSATVAPTTAAASATTGTAAPTRAATAAPSGTTAASSATTGTVTAASGTLTVFAAASLTDAFNELKTGFQAANPGVTITYNFAGSQALVTQLTQGAAADVFASADQPNMDNAVKNGVIAGTPQTFVKNKLVIIAPKDNKAGIQSPKDLAKPGIKFVTAQDSVPVGNYTQQVLDNFSKLPDYGADFKANVNKNVVSREDNVKAIVQKVQLGEADAGVVYTTDAQAAADKQNVIATYPIAVVKGAKQAALGQKFIDYVLSPAGQAVMKKWGFAPPA
jgi:molybdate transport system substrate-binding protein